jgi:predicted HAD superfamily phosphohydrolase YqeG
MVKLAKKCGLSYPIDSMEKGIKAREDYPDMSSRRQKIGRLATLAGYWIATGVKNIRNFDPELSGIVRAEIRSARDLRPEDLLDRGIEHVSFDFDNVFTPYGAENDADDYEAATLLPHEEGLTGSLGESMQRRVNIIQHQAIFFARFHQAGIKVTFVSNTRNPERIIDYVEGMNDVARRRFSAKEDVIQGLVIPSAGLSKSKMSKEDFERRQAACSFAITTGSSKPSGDMLKMAAAMVGTLPSESAYVGDQALQDTLAALNAQYKMAVNTVPFGNMHKGAMVLQALERAYDEIHGYTPREKVSRKLRIVESRFDGAVDKLFGKGRTGAGLPPPDAPPNR